jgi:hypothetical protein
MSNPFNFGNPVPPHKMVGRWNQVEAIAHDLTNYGGHSHIVVGGRRFGKSSFLEALQYFLLKQIDQRKEADWCVFPVLINLQRLIKHSPEGVFGLIVNTLYQSFDPLRSNKLLGVQFDLNLQHTRLHTFVQEKQKECTLDEFSGILDEFLDLFGNSYGLLRLVFLLDEIETGLDKAWTEIFFSQFRSLIYQGVLRNYIRCVIAGSSRVIDVREQGSPLLNMLNIAYLTALEKEDIVQIINWAENVPSSVSKAVLEQCGGHPFIAQYLMYHIWEMGPSKATVQSVMGLVNKFIHEREADLEQWSVDIGVAGQRTYRILAGSTNWLTETQIRQRIYTPDLKLGYGLTRLCYHGLAIHDGTWSKYRLSGQLFKGWFQNTIFHSPGVSEAFVRLPKNISNKKPDTTSIMAFPETDNSAETLRSPRTHAFISYSHKDKKYLQELQNHLVPYVRSEVLDIWDDTNLLPGSKWYEEIEKALASTRIAILLVSANFLASEFIRTIELPAFLSASEHKGAIILPVILRPCAFENTMLAQFQSVNALSNPLSKMKPGQRDEVWSKVAELVRDALDRDR